MAGVIKMAVKYYGGWTELWIVNFLIFTVFDWAALEIIYSIAAWLLLKGKGSEIEEPKSGKDKEKSGSNNPTENDTEKNRRAASDEENDSGEYGPIMINE